MDFHLEPPNPETHRHPKYPHLVLAEIDHHYGSYIFRIEGFAGSALISADDAAHIFGDRFDDQFAYVSDEYLDILETEV